MGISGHYEPERDRLSIGEPVVFVNDWLRAHCPGMYPAPGVVGNVDSRQGNGRYAVRWPKGSCSRDGAPWETGRENLMRECEWREARSAREQGTKTCSGANGRLDGGRLNRQRRK